MGTEVIQFPKRERGDLIWVCDCGCSTHRHYSDGRVACASCDNVGSVSSDGWRALLPPTPADPAEVLPDGFAVLSIDTAETFMRRRMKEAKEIEAVIVLNSEDGPSCWAVHKIMADVSALRRRLIEAVDRMCAGGKVS